MVNKVPVEQVGGPQEEGPWPDSVEEIAEGKAYNREVHATNFDSNGNLIEEKTTTVEVTVTNIVDLGNDGYAVGYTYPDQFGGGN